MSGNFVTTTSERQIVSVHSNMVARKTYRQTKLDFTRKAKIDKSLIVCKQRLPTDLWKKIKKSKFDLETQELNKCYNEYFEHGTNTYEYHALKEEDDYDPEGETIQEHIGYVVSKVVDYVIAYFFLQMLDLLKGQTQLWHHRWTTGDLRTDIEMLEKLIRHKFKTLIKECMKGFSHPGNNGFFSHHWVYHFREQLQEAIQGEQWIIKAENWDEEKDCIKEELENMNNLGKEFYVQWKEALREHKTGNFLLM